jgi:hypothetical protein
LQGQVFTTAVIARDINNKNTSFDGNVFTGVFDGNNHKITHLTINGGSNRYIGLFGDINSTGLIKNLGLENFAVSGAQSVGGLVGFSRGSSIINSYSTGTVTGGSNSLYLGGLVGYIYNGGSIINCYSTSDVNGGNESQCLGGLVGRSYYGSISISDCYSTGSVRGTYNVGGLAGYNNGDINNCSSTGSVSGSSAVGGLAGGNDNGGNINNCSFTGSVSGSDNIGGLAGGNSGNINNCYSTGSVNGWSEVSEVTSYVGGLVGWNNNGSIINCYSTGTVTTGGNNSSGIGGLVGGSHISGSSISNCYSTSTVTGGDGSALVGGFVGDNWSGTGTIRNCYSTGTVNGNYQVGGFAGSSSGKISNCYATGKVTGLDYVGGLVGSNTRSSINSCYATGNVSGGNSSQYLGGLVGLNTGSISSGYFLVTSGPDNNLGEPLTDEQMRQQASFVGWDFNDIWHICETINYPKLKWQILPGDIVCPDGVAFEDLGELCSQWLIEEIPPDVMPPGGNGIVDFADFAVFADQWGVTKGFDELLDFTRQWLKTGLPVCSADISPLPGGDGRVNFADFALMASDWLQ